MGQGLLGRDASYMLALAETKQKYDCFKYTLNYLLLYNYYFLDMYEEGEKLLHTSNRITDFKSNTFGLD